jgi:hypothetical protein
VADVIGIDIEHVNFAAEYKDRVFAEFLREYSGRPHAQPRRAVQRRDQVQGLPRPRDAPGRRAWIATGHYARVRRVPTRTRPGVRHELLKGLDASKDQSYFLHRSERRPSWRARCSRWASCQDRGAPHRRRASGCRTREEGLDRHLLHRRAAVPRVPEPLPADRPARS